MDNTIFRIIANNLQFSDGEICQIIEGENFNQNIKILIQKLKNYDNCADDTTNNRRAFHKYD